MLRSTSARASALQPPNAADLDWSNMNAEEIVALEKRPTNAGCYKGAIDGKTSAALGERERFQRISTCK